MPDRRTHRGRAPQDEDLFAAPAWPGLRAAVADLSLLHGRGYSLTAGLKLVGDHHGLRERQRLAVLRCAASTAERDARAARRQRMSEARGRVVLVDGFNCLITVEAALGGALLLRGRDRVLRDLAGVHGSYRRVAETEPALRALGAALAAHAPAAIHVFLDRPISNSGRLRAFMLDLAAASGWPWQVSLVDNPDREILAALSEQGSDAPAALTATSDAVILDHCAGWLPLAEAAVAAVAPAAWIVDLGDDDDGDLGRG
jgi:hypothetical protein